MASYRPSLAYMLDPLQARWCPRTLVKKIHEAKWTSRYRILTRWRLSPQHLFQLWVWSHPDRLGQVCKQEYVPCIGHEFWGNQLHVVSQTEFPLVISMVSIWTTYSWDGWWHGCYQMTQITTPGLGADQDKSITTDKFVSTLVCGGTYDVQCSTVVTDIDEHNFFPVNVIVLSRYFALNCSISK